LGAVVKFAQKTIFTINFVLAFVHIHTMKR
jgi:hypothetical protein